MVQNIIDEKEIGLKKESSKIRREAKRDIHVWIINRNNELLLEKRSDIRYTFPNYWDASVVGHLKDKESVIDGAIRELRKKLGVEAVEEDLEYITTNRYTRNEEKDFNFQYVYLMRCNKKIDEYFFRDKYISEAKYIYFKDLEKMVAERPDNLVWRTNEYKQLFQYIRNFKD